MLDWINTPISEDAPAGPDLLETEDPEFDAYYFDAVERMPEPDDYHRPALASTGNHNAQGIFQSKSTTQELASIDGLLRSSRDVRLLTLRAQWSILGGDLEQCVQSVEGMAALLTEMPDQAHPSLAGGTADRLEAINDLSQLGAFVLPLRYLDIAGTGTTLRKMMAARREVTPQPGEEDVNQDALVSALVGSKDDVAEVGERLVRLSNAVAQVETACLTAQTPHTPRLQVLKDEIASLHKLIAEADPELAPLAAAQDDGASSAEADGEGASSPATPPTVPASEVKSANDARARLEAVELYFAAHEPSSAAVLLVTQARLLIGKSLIDAFDMLMPNTTSRATVSFAEENGFTIEHSQLRQLADQAPPAAPFEASEAQPDTDSADPHPVPSHVVQSSAEASGQMLAVENYFRSVERSSPIPVLLGRARAFIGKDFVALMNEFVPKPDH